MTNELSTERAIEALYTVRAYYASLTAEYPKGKDCRGIGDVMCSEIANSCLMAIKALETQTSENCISREAVLEFLKGFEILHNHDELRSNLIYGIKHLPSVTPQQTRWISVSEGLPEEGGTYLITTKIEIHDLKPYYEVRTAKFDGKYFDIGYIGDGFRVIAWMPLPEPYRSESE